MSDLLKVKVGGSDYLCKWEPSYKIIGGRKYKTVVIGNQEWLAENLDYRFDVNGSPLPMGGNSGTYSTPRAWYYNNDEAAYGIDGTYKCGMLYNWWAGKYLDDNRALLLPDGWRVPTADDIGTLFSTVGGMSIAPAKLKALDNSVTSDWPSGWNGTDDYGFNALPAGRSNNGFQELGDCFYFQNTTDLGGSNRPQYGFSKNGYIYTYWGDKYPGVSIRLVRDMI